jgi:hypothetical protein
MSWAGVIDIQPVPGEKLSQRDLLILGNDDLAIHVAGIDLRHPQVYTGLTYPSFTQTTH